jgi:predicted amino acid dehydrogenase
MFGEEVCLRRFGADGNLERVVQLVGQLDGQVDAIGLDRMRIHYRVGRRQYPQRHVQRIVQAARTTPVVDGWHVQHTLGRWTVSQVARQQPGIFSHKRVFVLSGIEDYALAQVLTNFSDRILFGDPLFQLNLPFALRGFRQLGWYVGLVLPLLCRNQVGIPGLPTEDGSWSKGLGLRAEGEAARLFRQAQVIVGDIPTIRRFAPEDLGGKIVISDSLSAVEIEDLRERGVEALVTLTPPLGEEQPFVGAEVVEAVLVSLGEDPKPRSDTDRILNLVARSELEPGFTVLNEPEALNRFAFVIHPLSVESIFNHPRLRVLRFLPKWLVERALANAPPLYLSRIKGIRSAATGQEVEGYLLSLGATPRELMRRKPGFTYRRLIVASRMAQQRGARIMGLGAFTKVVGDAGMTVAYKSDIAITSGNSLTVVATLEAAKRAVLRMGGRTDRGRAVVIGATGSIGSVCSRLIAQAIQDVVLVAPRPEKLIALQRTIEAETPGARVTIATEAGPHLSGADLVVTTTTAIGQKVIDVRWLKPGCVVCDVARPPDVREEDARLRPDVLVVESGEILLPGEPDFGFDIGLPPGVAYACLAEAAVLAMEGRFESYTLGRNIEMDRVKEMYRLFRRHGLELEGLRSFGRYVSNEEIESKRALADDLRQHPERLEALIAEGARSQSSPTKEMRPPTPGPGLWAAAAVGLAAVVAGLLLSRQRRNGE